MQIERLFYPVDALGPGKRLAIWTIGCSKECSNCISRELWHPRPDKNIMLPQLINFVKKVLSENEVDGITISGGDPLEQREEFLQFISAIHPLCDDILVYTGYTLQELCVIWTENELERLKKYVSVLIDGRYVDALNDSKSPLIGSTNQEIHFFDESKRTQYEQLLLGKGRSVQNIYNGERVISIGIHNKE